jgi:hypothetical protein
MTVFVLVPLSIALSVHFAALWSQQVFEGQPWFHPIPPRGAWIPWIHPPGYAEFMHQVAALSERLWISEGFLIFVSSGLVTALLVLIFTAELTPLVGAPWAWFASALLIFSPGALRPFEHYPLSKLVATIGVLLALRYAREGKRWVAVGAFAACLAAVMLHLSTWFVIGPALAAAAVLSTGHRRGGVVLTAVLVGTFLLLGFTGLYELVGSTGPAENKSANVVAWSNLTYEWNDPWLWAPLLLWTIPAVRHGRRAGAALVFGMGAYCFITFAMMWQALVIGGTWVGSHHYFELIDGLACFAAAFALGAAHGSFESPRVRTAIVVGAGVLFVEHLRWWFLAIAKLEQLALYPG